MPTVHRLAPLLVLFTTAFGLAACGGGGGGGSAGLAGPLDFVLVTTAGNTTGTTTTLDHPALNGNPDALVILTSIAKPGGGFPQYYPGGPLITQYDDTTGQWQFWETSGSSGPNYAYYVSIFPRGPTSFRHVTAAGNIESNTTRLSHPMLDGNPGARILVTMNQDLGGTGATRLNNHHIGIWYDTGTASWHIFNQNLAVMREDVGFNVVILPAGVPAYIHENTTTTRRAPGSGQTNVDVPWLTGDPAAIVHITPVFSEPGLLTGQYVDALPVLVYTDPIWSIEANLPFSAEMPLGARYLVTRIDR
ncbi:MAG: hypothetical protein QNJ98_06375 [Planctomycetota bacterium]|nr:hypothetical protein [Planctomycetota bacterium]